ncbi:integration host factor subunit beta [Cupriavidus respiraculi]|uniref:Integration host factor subunit beta n=1 Tax=Cupriavidus respiraculi TaxID=195930 RepID=A0ABN7YNX6_9BURK|nr:integration host factor subunit beta [Cupriavidus respiraculi]MBY4945783.1 integration host factor subunit beta [Cupriavidus respiraculi]CAG9174121.1 Integration host factor subunit beta [Cupriavidus respiraculi]
MTKSELVEKLAARFPQLLLRDADISVKTILDAMSEALADGHRIEIRGFGSFGLNRRPPRVGRNPKSGERVLVPEKRVPHFKAGKELRERVDRSPLAQAPASPDASGSPSPDNGGAALANGHATHAAAHAHGLQAANAAGAMHEAGGLNLVQS